MKHLLLSICITFSATYAIAQPVNVRSGEHEDFTRIVLDIAPGTEWSLTSDTNGAGIRLVDHTDGFDTARVFEKIDRSVIAAVDSSSDSLDLQFACDCEATGFPVGDRMVAIDVSKAPEHIDPPQPMLTSPFVGQAPLRFSKEPRTQETVEAKRPVASTPNSQIPDMFIEAAPNIRADISAEETDLDALLLAQQKLAERIGAAASRGLLRPSIEELDLPDPVTRPHIDTAVFEAPTLAPNETPVGGNLRVSSSADIPQRAEDTFLTSTTLGVRCIDPGLVAVREWAPEAGFTTAIARLRSRLYSEFDRLDPDAVLELARTYLHFGFGAEALQTLALMEEIQREAPELRNLAEIMEFGHGRSTNYLTHFVDCDTDVALWAILSAPSVPPSRTINTDAAIRALSALPMHLRRFIAPELSTRLIGYGDEAAAAAALRGLERTEEPLGDPANLAKATLELRNGETVSAKARLSEIVSSNSEQSAQALIAYVETQMETKGKVDEEIATLVEAYAMELRDAPIASDLLQAHVLALAKSGQFDRAIDVMARVNAQATGDRVQDLRSSVLYLLTQDAGDDAFLRIAFEQGAAHASQLSPKTRVNMARRLTELGFFSEAETLLASSSELPNGSAAQLLRAQISLGLSRPAEALALLFGVTGSQADALRAEAYAQTGDFDTAHTAFSALGDQNSSLRAAFLSDDWSVLLEPAEPVFGPVAQVAQTELRSDAALEGMLQRTSTALEESAQARRTIEALLQSTVDVAGAAN